MDDETRTELPTPRARIDYAISLANASQQAILRWAGLAPTHLTVLRFREKEAAKKGKTAGFSLPTAQALGAVLGIDLNWLLSGEGARPTRESVAIAVERAREAHKTKAAAKLPRTRRQAPARTAKGRAA